MNFKNLAGVDNCNVNIKLELDAVGIKVNDIRFTMPNSEVPWSIYGTLDGWTFTRAWRYWICESKTPLMFIFANELNKYYGDTVRVDGSYACKDKPVVEYYGENGRYRIGVEVYHVDTLEGLDHLVSAIKDQTEYLKTFY